MGLGTFRMVGVWICLMAGVSSAKSAPRYWTEAKARRVQRQRSEIARVARNAMPAVVAITTQQPPDPTATDAGSGEPQKGIGSGFIIHSDGYILTSAHVIEGAEQIDVQVTSADGASSEYPAEVVGQDGATDFAILKIKAPHKLPVLKLSSVKAVEVADWVVVIGNPFGLAHSVSVGVVSYKGRTDIMPSGRTGYFDYMQTDAAINPGNSGGPVLDLNGNVVAIANAVNISGQGIAFAIPIDMAKQVIPQLWSRGRVQRGWMGISVQDVTPELTAVYGLPGQRGVVVSDIVTDGPAARAGLQVGDLITRVDRSGVQKAHALRWKVATSGVGEEVAVQVHRKGRPLQVKVKLTEMPTEELVMPAEEILSPTPAKHD